MFSLLFALSALVSGLLCAAIYVVLMVMLLVHWPLWGAFAVVCNVWLLKRIGRLAARRRITPL